MKIHKCESKFYSGSYSAYCSYCGYDFSYGESHERFCEKATVDDIDNANDVSLLNGLIGDIIEATPQWKWKKWRWNVKTVFSGNFDPSYFLGVTFSGSQQKSNLTLNIWIDGSNLCIQPVCKVNKAYKICLNNPRHIDEVIKLFKKFKGE